MGFAADVLDAVELLPQRPATGYSRPLPPLPSIVVFVSSTDSATTSSRPFLYSPPPLHRRGASPRSDRGQLWFFRE